MTTVEFDRRTSTAILRCFLAWQRTQPQLTIDGWADMLDGLDQTEPRRSLGLIEPAPGLTSGAEPRCATPEALTALCAAPPATPNAGGSAPSHNNGDGANPSKEARRPQEVTLHVR